MLRRPTRGAFWLLPGAHLVRGHPSLPSRQGSSINTLAGRRRGWRRKPEKASTLTARESQKMGRLRFELRTNRLKAEWRSSKTLSLKGSSAKLSQEKSQECAQREHSLCLKSVEWVQDPSMELPFAERPKARPASTLNPWLTARSRRSCGLEQNWA